MTEPLARTFTDSPPVDVDNMYQAILLEGLQPRSLRLGCSPRHKEGKTFRLLGRSLTVTAVLGYTGPNPTPENLVGY